jgi:hypothetical protein
MPSPIAPSLQSLLFYSSLSVFIIYDETPIKLTIDEPVMDDLSPLHPVLVMLLFQFVMGVIRLDSNCMELSTTEGILPRGGVMKPSLLEDISEK